MAGAGAGLGGGGVNSVTGGGGSDAEKSTLVELMRLQRSAMTQAAGGATTPGGIPGLPSHANHVREHPVPATAKKETPHVTSVPANFPITHVPAGLGYVAAPMMHSGRPLPSPWQLLISRQRSRSVLLSRCFKLMFHRCRRLHGPARPRGEATTRRNSVLPARLTVRGGPARYCCDVPSSAADLDHGRWRCVLTDGSTAADLSDADRLYAARRRHPCTGLGRVYASCLDKRFVGAMGARVRKTVRDTARAVLGLSTVA